MKKVNIFCMLRKKMAFQSWLFMINANVGYMNMKCICLHRIKTLRKYRKYSQFNIDRGFPLDMTYYLKTQS